MMARHTAWMVAVALSVLTSVSVAAEPGDTVQNKAAPVGDAKAGAAGETPVPTEGGPIGATRQTMPAKFSERNDTLDHLPTMAQPLPLSDEQRRKIVAAVRAGSHETVALDAKPAMQVPTDIRLNALPESVSDMPAVKNYRFIQLKDRIVLVNPTDRAVVGEIRE